jgi:hypothetical protein
MVTVLNVVSDKPDVDNIGTSITAAVTSLLLLLSVCT